MAEYRFPVDVGNRSLQHCGAERMDSSGLAENSKRASEINFCIGKLREAELRANVWTFACRRALLRAVDDDTMLLAPALYDATATYFVGSIVADQYGNRWISKIPSNLANDPLSTTTPYWEPYFGPMAVALYDSTVAYGAGELVYTAAGDGTYRVYLSLQSSNEDVPGTATAYDATVTYFKNQVVTSAAIAYMSLLDLNIAHTPASSPTAWTTSFTGGTGSIKWLQIGGAEFPAGVALEELNIIYPLSTGPSTQSGSRNVFVLPSGFLRIANQNPKPGTAWLGGPSGYTYNDWVLENGFLLSMETGPIAYRFVANVTDVARMDPMFCEGWAARIGFEICEPVTQSSTKKGVIAKTYAEWMGKARTANAIEQGPEDSPDDDFITCRL